MDRLEELILDTPDAPLVVGKFVARADWDGCLPDNFLEEERYGASDTLTLKCLDQAYAVIKDSHSVATCWGTVIGGFTDTNTLTEKVSCKLGCNYKIILINLHCTKNFIFRFESC